MTNINAPKNNAISYIIYPSKILSKTALIFDRNIITNIVWDTITGYIPIVVNKGNKITPPPSPHIIAIIPIMKTAILTKINFNKE